jgi:hypothetical protein
MTEKIRVQSVFLERAEGPTAECIAVTVPTLTEATATLRRWSWSAPKPGGGYDKCDFRVTFADGETYEGRYDLQRDLAGEGPLSKHIRDFMLFCAGQRRPSHMTEDVYRGFVHVQFGDPAPYLEFLARYDLEER